jgi:hypothetical protein
MAAYLQPALTPEKRQQPGWIAEAELLRDNAAAPRRQEVAQLMNEDQYAKYQHKTCNIDQAHHPIPFAISTSHQARDCIYLFDKAQFEFSSRCDRFRKESL